MSLLLGDLSQLGGLLLRSHEIVVLSSLKLKGSDDRVVDSLGLEGLVLNFQLKSDGNVHV